MATRLLQHRWPASFRGRPHAWFSSGILTGSAVIKAKAGIVGWLCVHATDNGGDIHVKVWDSPDDTLTDDVVLAQQRVSTTTSGAHRHQVIPLPGVEAEHGIYLEVVAGDCEAVVGYK